MSFVLRAVLNAIALESERIRGTMAAITEQAAPNRTGLLNLALPSPFAEPTATNLITDPQGLGAGTAWAVTNGTRGVADGSTPTRWSRSVFVESDGAGASRIGATFTPQITGTHTLLLLARTEGSYSGTVSAQVRSGTISGTLTAGSTALAGPFGWTLFQFTASLTAATTYALLGGWSTTPTAGTRLHVTGLTASFGTLEEAFSGDFDDTENYTYRWRAARNGSPSVRHGRDVDLVALREEEAALDVRPEGLTVEQRRDYLVKRRQARHHGDAQTFRALIAALIQTDNPSFTVAGVRIDEDIDDYSFKVQISYAPTGKLATRVEHLIEDIKPAHLALTGITWGAFQAGVNQAGQAV